jgi:hypothetical protein
VPTRIADSGSFISVERAVTLSATGAAYFCTSGSATPTDCSCGAPDANYYGKVMPGTDNTKLKATMKLYVRACDANNQASTNVWTAPEYAEYQQGLCSLVLL